jgi:hypothetical protein
MMSKLYGDSIHMYRVINHLNQYFETNFRIYGKNQGIEK